MTETVDNKEVNPTGAYNLERRKLYSVKDVFAEILPHMYDTSLPNNSVFDGIPIKTRSLRYKVFNQSLVCSCCGVEGTYFAAEKTPGSSRYHFNLYATDSEGKEVLMTKDHILPKSCGGKDSLYNLETMCVICNSKKSSTIPEGIAKLSKFILDKIGEKESVTFVIVLEDTDITKSMVNQAVDYINWDSKNEYSLVAIDDQFDSTFIEVRADKVYIKLHQGIPYHNSVGMPVSKLRDFIRVNGVSQSQYKLNMSDKELKVLNDYKGEVE